MIRISKFTDYGIIILSYLAHNLEKQPCSASLLAKETSIPLPTVTKLLKNLNHARLLVSERGLKGGYSLARSPDDLNVAEVVTALEGPIAITECGDDHGRCKLQQDCPVRNNWRKINRAVLKALEILTIADMADPRATLRPEKPKR